MGVLQNALLLPFVDEYVTGFPRLPLNCLAFACAFQPLRAFVVPWLPHCLYCNPNYSPLLLSYRSDPRLPPSLPPLLIAISIFQFFGFALSIASLLQLLIAVLLAQIGRESSGKRL